MPDFLPYDPNPNCDSNLTPDLYRGDRRPYMRTPAAPWDFHRKAALFDCNPLEVP